ncbi:hypothetical protein BJ875DRAFT_425088 [Amylocarpus encephaloides]|uniref:Tyrosinase copper-binding domain-containing protein n=1 Tax=Amylocarpus encephaloides TaxID=45428 RepID=A0A9P8C4U3_9HELO|nr:hypothetical protein BJ875DRAFT_425088 [Amylocarpus encephaloides]
MSLTCRLSLWAFAIAHHLNVAFAAIGSTAAGDAATVGQYYGIVGLTSGINSQTGARPYRQDIRNLVNDIPAFSLYIQSLIAMQNSNPNDQLSWFQIAGIHGRPYIPWNNVGPTSSQGIWNGYCPHNSILFPTWHRPYLALMEQILGTYAQNTAKKYSPSDRPTYQAAANRLRMPYWDWASDSDIPAVVSQDKVQIVTPTGSQTISNPLLQYQFPRPLDQNQFPPSILSGYTHTVRAPTSTDKNAVSNPEGINPQLASANLMQRTWSSLVKSKLYNSFSTSNSPGPSIENVHNDVHGIVGGQYGHMTYLEYSGFDPIFWLHHANIDRLFALWQAMNPNQPLLSGREPAGTFALPVNNLDTTITPLYPFTSNSDGQLYTSASSMSMKNFGYTYPEIEDWHQSKFNLQRNVTSQVNNMYDPNGTFRKRSRRLQTRHTLQAGTVSREWSIGVKVGKFDFEGCYFAIRFFVGEVPKDRREWPTAYTLIGTMALMPPPHDKAMDTLPEVIVNDEFSLTRVVLAAGHDPADVEGVARFLKQNLSWRVQKADGHIIEAKKLLRLEVSVYDESLSMPTDITELPKFGHGKNYHLDITKHKAGGLKNLTVAGCA